MSREVLVIAPHPDDETLGCGGTLLKHKLNGDNIHWVICTEMTPELGYSAEQIRRRDLEIDLVKKAYAFSSLNRLGFPTTTLDRIGLAPVISKIAEIFSRVAPEIVYLPFRGDVHSDHTAAFDAAIACCKSFRASSVKKILCYETLSETDFAMSPEVSKFYPQVFIGIEDFLQLKLEILSIYDGEIGAFPFPRSVKAIESLAAVRGAASGTKAAESFMLLREIQA